MVERGLSFWHLRKDLGVSWPVGVLEAGGCSLPWAPSGPSQKNPC